MLRLAWVYLKASLMEMLRYPFEMVNTYISLILIFGGIFLGIKAFAPSVGLEANKAGFFLGYMLWTFYLFTANSASWTIYSAATMGYLEREFSSPFGHTLIVVIKIITDNLASLIHYILIAILMILIFGVDLKLDLIATIGLILAAYPFFLGVGLIFAGLALNVKRIGSFISLVQIIFMFLAFVGGGKLSPGVVSVVRYFPYLQALRLAKAITIRGVRWSELFVSNEFATLLATSLISFAIGWAFFKVMDRQAMRKGVIGHY